MIERLAPTYPHGIFDSLIALFSISLIDRPLNKQK